MSERLPSPEQPHEHTPLDQVLFQMAEQSWGTAREIAPDGSWFVMVDIRRVELAECVAAFDDEIIASGLEDPTDLVGRWYVEYEHGGYQAWGDHEHDDRCSECRAHVSEPHDPRCSQSLQGEGDEFWEFSTDAARWSPGIVRRRDVSEVE